MASRDLRWSVRRTRVLHKLRRWTGRSFFQLTQHSREPTEINTGGLGITPLWHSDQRGPDDLDLARPRLVTRRYTLGLLWTVTHDYDEFRAVVLLVVDKQARAWLISPRHRRFPATPSGWRDLVTEVAQEYSSWRGGRWHGIG
ncbi:hypothetical protein [Actinokineospora pegani]|uniref:hypothetical protein n=1 Tax=Actinokineospora pegani TaxID=2654637 RepID=UPI0012EA8E73|nr:hypothetical protein [Actinokineospora pegani]